MSEKVYRPCVVAVFIRDDGKVLACQREDNHKWQFPQGGQEEGESSKEALYREAREEIGSKDFSILKASEKTVNYDFPKSLTTPITKSFKGQEQTWFLCAFLEGASFEPDKVLTPEFIDFKWTSLSFVLDQIVSWKKEAYLEGLKSLGL